MEFAEDVLRTGQRVEKRAICFVDPRRKRFCLRAAGAGRVCIWVDKGLEVADFAAEIGFRDLEGRCWWWTARGDCLREYRIVGFDVDAGSGVDGGFLAVGCGR